MTNTRTIISFTGLLLLTFNVPMVLTYFLVDIPDYLQIKASTSYAKDLHLLTVISGMVCLTLLTPTSLLLIGRLHHNASKLAVPRYSRSITLFSFFIPILNLFRPYQALKDIWYSSQVFEKAKTSHLPVFLIWWIPFVLAFMVPVAEALGSLGRRAPASQATFWSLTVELLSWLAMSGAFYHIVNRMGAWQDAATSHNSM